MQSVLTGGKCRGIVKHKLIHETVEAEITAIMPLQRARDAENRVRNKSSNGPLRAQSNAGIWYPAEYSATWRHTLVAGDMIVSC